MAKKRKKKEKIIIYFRNNIKIVIPKKFWDDYEYIPDGFFVVIKNEAWVAIYNMVDVHSIVVK